MNSLNVLKRKSSDLNGDEISAQPQPKHRNLKIPNDQCKILEEWYLSHIIHPYPKPEDMEEFVIKTELDLSGITKWFNNRRQKEDPEIKKTWINKPLGVQQSTRVYLNNEKKSLLNQWYLSHRDNGIGPYPTNEEKSELTKTANIALAKLDNWFHAKRMKESKDVKDKWDAVASKILNRQPIGYTKPITKITNACPICRKPYNLSNLRKIKDLCGHNYCHACVAANENCPTCQKEEISSEELFQNDQNCLNSYIAFTEIFLF